MRSIIHFVMGFTIFNNLCGITVHTIFSVRALSPGFQPRKYVLPYWFAYGSCNLILDLIIWALPIRSILSILHNLSTRKKFSLILTFTVGMLCWCASTLRISCWRFAVDANSDPAYNTPILTLLGVIEVCLAMSCVSLVTLRPLVAEVTKWFNRLKGIPTSTKDSSQPDYKNSKPLDCEFEKSQGLPHYGTGGFRTTGNKGGFGDTAVGPELAEWEDNGLEIKEPRAVQQACSCSRMDGDAELRNIVPHASPCPIHPNPAGGTQFQVSALVTMSQSTTGRLSNSSDGETHKTATTATTIGACLSKHTWPPCDTRLSSESTISLTSAVTNEADTNEADTKLSSKDSKPLA